MVDRARMTEATETFDAETVRTHAAAADTAERQIRHAVMEHRIVDGDAARETAIEHILHEATALREHIQDERFFHFTQPDDKTLDRKSVVAGKRVVGPRR